MAAATFRRIPANEVEVGTPAYPRGEVVSVSQSPSGMTTIVVRGYDRWNLQADGVFQFSPRKTFKARA